jgi:hypothetical protein
MLAKKPSDRYPDPSALLRDLHQLSAEGAAEGWAAKPDEWSLADMIMVADDRAEATSRLDDLMKTVITPRRSRRTERWRAAMIAIGVLVGIGIAAWAKQPTLLADHRHDMISTYEDPWMQLYHAKKYNTAALWEAAVAQATKKNDPLCQNLARMGLALRLLNTSEYSAAIEPLKKLAYAPDSTAESFLAFGRAGLIVAYSHLQRDAEALGEWSQSQFKDQREIVMNEMPAFFNNLYLEAETAFLQRQL